MTPKEQREIDVAIKREQIAWLKEAAQVFRVRLDQTPDNLGPISDGIASSIRVILEAQLAALLVGMKETP